MRSWSGRAGVLFLQGCLGSLVKCVGCLVSSVGTWGLVSCFVFVQDAAGASNDRKSCRTGAYSIGSLRSELNTRSNFICHNEKTQVQVNQNLEKLLVLPRAQIPKSWFTPSVRWDNLLARRWRFLQRIVMGEARAQTIYQKVLSRIPGLRRYRYLDLPDNSNVVDVNLRGRAGPEDSNGQVRARLVYEAVLEPRCVIGWVPTTNHC